MNGPMRVGAMLGALVLCGLSALAETVHVRGGLTNSTRPVATSALDPHVELWRVTVEHQSRIAHAYESDVHVEGRHEYTGDVVGLAGWVCSASIRQGWTLRTGSQALIAGRAISNVDANDLCIPGDGTIDWSGPSAAWFDTPATSSASQVLTREQLEQLTLTTQGRSEVHMDIWVVFVPGYTVHAQLAWLCYSAWEADVTFEPLDPVQGGDTLTARADHEPELQELIAMADPNAPKLSDADKAIAEKAEADKRDAEKAAAATRAKREAVQYLPPGDAKPQRAFILERSKVDPNVATLELDDGTKVKSCVRWGQGERPDHACWRTT